MSIVAIEQAMESDLCFKSTKVTYTDVVKNSQMYGLCGMSFKMTN